MAPLPPFSDRLLRWFDAARRDLPWRRTRDPWAIWVSEVMLQQTRVEAVRKSYEHFVASYPTAAAFARASDDELMLAWRGLGYYRRARLLRDGARAVVANHGGRVPRDADAIGELPGVGAYTRGAIASIAFDLPLPAIDGNVERVLARHLALRQDVATAPMRRAIAAAASERLDRARPGDFNQAMMELGAMVCTPTSPRCEQCPVAIDCQGHRAGIAMALPVRKPATPPLLVAACVAVVPAGSGVLALRVPAHEPNAGQWDLPGPGVLQSVDEADFTQLTAARCGARIELGLRLVSVRHSITNHRITVGAHAGTNTSRARGKLEVLRPEDPAVPWTTVRGTRNRRASRSWA